VETPPKKRPPKPKPADIKVDWPLIEGLLQQFTPVEDVVRIINFPPKLLDRCCRAQKKMDIFRYTEMHYALGRAEILRLQNVCAESGRGNPRVLIWLGMQHCGQSMRTAQIYKPKGNPVQPTPITIKPHSFITDGGKNAVEVITEPVRESAKALQKEPVEVESILAEEEQAAAADPMGINVHAGIMFSAHTGEPIDG
jgi:hypothetical protein